MYLLILFCVLTFSAIVHNENVKRESSGNSLLWIIAKQLDRLESKLQDMQKQYNSRDAEIETMKKKIQRQSKGRHDIRPAFSAHFKSSGFKFLRRGQILIFDKVQFNVGGGYNPWTGYFTVPRPGLYIVSCKVRSYSKKNLHVWLKKNNHRVTLGYGNNYNEGSFSIPVQVAKGDKLVIEHGTGSYVVGESVQGTIVSFFSAVFISD